MEDYPVKELAYQIILTEATTIANHDSRKPEYLSGDTFRCPPTFENLELWFDPSIRTSIEAARKHRGETRTEGEIMDLLAEIVRDAVQRTISSNSEAGEALGAIIVHALRNETPPGDWF